MINEKGYGAIYGSTWWGSGDALTNQIGWGSAMFYILGPAYLRQRTEEDGGTIEAFQCVSRALRTFPQADLGRQLFDAYNARCEADSGETEARDCTITAINDLL